MDDLNKLRDEIDSIDHQLVALFEKRMEIVLKIAEYKKQKHVPIFNENRENEIIKKNTSYVKDEYLKKPVEDFFNRIMEISRGIQKQKILNDMKNKISTIK